MARLETYAFGAALLDVAERRLTIEDRPVSLEPKALDLLIALVRRAGRLVTKRELLDAVWPDAAVEEGILSVHVSTLRKALRTCGPAEPIETVARSGYRFVAPVTRRTASAQPTRLLDILPAQPEVHELIGRGRVHLMSASRAELPKAIDAFRSAVDLDPTYAAAHAGLALACCAQAELRIVPHQQAYEDARAAALRALAMDDACADAQVALGSVLFFSDWNWTGARRSLQRALDLDPAHTEAYLLYGRLLEALGEFCAALSAKRKALERNPFSALVHLQIAHNYWNQRRYDDVIAWANKTLALDSRHLLAREYLASAWMKKGDVDRHMAESLAHAEAAGAPPSVVAQLRDTYAAGGRRAILEYAIRSALAQPHGGFPLQLAVLYGESGQLDEAFHHLNRALDTRDPSIVHLAVSPQWDPLRGDARFAGCLERMGLAHVQV